jgi:hypothetical protein
MEKYQKEVSDLQLKIHGQFATIEHNGINEEFYSELAKEGITMDAYQDSFQKLTDYYCKDYEDNKEESDSEFLKEVINDKKRIVEIASLIVE